MRVLVLAGIAPSTVFSQVPLATALRDAGHQVMMSGSVDEMVDVITSTGMPAVPATVPGVTVQEIITAGGKTVDVPDNPVDRERMSGRWYARLEAATLGPLRALASDWRPDVIIGGTGAFAAPLLAAELGVPWVRQSWDIHDWTLVEEDAADELSGELAALGLDEFGVPDLEIDITPPSLRPPGARPAQGMRWISVNTQCRLEPWMYTRGARTRIGVTIGVGVDRYHQHDFLAAVVRGLAPLDAEIIVPVTSDAVPAMSELLPDARVAWIPLDVAAPTCDVLVHHTGGANMMTALAHGVPQVLIPAVELYRANQMAATLAAAGASVTLSPAQAATDAIAKTCQDIISNPSYASAAAGIAKEIAAQPIPADIARRIEQLPASR